MEILFFVVLIGAAIAYGVHRSNQNDKIKLQEARDYLAEQARQLRLDCIHAYERAFGNHVETIKSIERIGRSYFERERKDERYGEFLLLLYGRVCAIYDDMHIIPTMEALEGKSDTEVRRLTEFAPHARAKWDEIVKIILSHFADNLPKSQQSPVPLDDMFFSGTVPVKIDEQIIGQQVVPIFDTLRLYAGATVPTLLNPALKKYIFPEGAFAQLRQITFSYDVPGSLRFEHMWIVAPPGSGKTTALSVFLMLDLLRATEDKCSVIVMESNRDLVKSIERISMFAPDGPNADRLISIDIEDVDFPIALNLFDIGGDTEQLNSRDREALYNSTVSMLDYVFRALLGAELTSKQSTLFNFTIALLLKIPNATLDTMIALMQPNGIMAYAQYLDQLDDDAKLFFRVKFGAKEFEQTKSQVVDRLFAIKRIRTLSRMFSAPKTKLNLYEEMGKGRVILINAAKSLLQEEGVEIVTRFFLASILLAAEKRQLIEKKDRLPCYVYIDEAQDTIRRDEKLPIILDQARKFRVGMILAHQRLDQMTPPVLNALYSSTAIKMAANLSDANASALARNMATTAEFLASQPKYHFALFARGVTPNAVTWKIPEVDFANGKQMTDAQMRTIRDKMRRRYSYTPSAAAEPQSPSPTTPGQKNPEKYDPTIATTK